MKEDDERMREEGAYGYVPTTRLRFRPPLSNPCLQQLWVSRFEGHEPEWRDVPIALADDIGGG